jgi:RHS repeat-associated protein
MPGMTGSYKFHWKKLKGDTAADSGITDFNWALNYPADNANYSTIAPALFSSAPSVMGGQYVEGGTVLFNPIVLTEIELPTGQSYKFSYNVFGQIEKTSYPTGGEEKFSYQTVIPLSETPLFYQQANLGVYERRVYETANSGTPLLWRYEIALPQNLYRMDVTAPDLTKTERFLYRGNPPCTVCPGNFGYDNGLAGMAYEEHSLSGTGQILAKKIITRAIKEFNYNTYKAGWHPRVTQEESIIYDTGGNGVSTTVKYEYEGDLNQRETPVLVNKINQYASVVPSAPIPSTPLKTTETTYLINDASIAQSTRDIYKNQNMVGLPTIIAVKDGAGTIVAQSKIKYDESGYSPNVGRSNSTTNQVWDSTKGIVTDDSAYLQTHTKFDTYGNVIEVTDAKGNVSTTEYSSTYNYAYPTKVMTTIPDSSGVNGSSTPFQTTTTYDPTTGMPLSVTDANGQTSQMEYNDPLLRPTKVTAPNGQQTITQYGNQQSRWAKVRTQIDGVNWKEATVYSDGLGRPIKNELIDSNGTIFTETEYDDMGRGKRATNPYRQGGQKFWNKTDYDEAGRVKETFAPAPDGQTGTSLGTIQYSVSTVPNYVGTVVTTTDAAGKKSRSIKNSMDQLIRVDEATGSNDLGDITAPNQATYYSYNTLGKMVKVQQGNQYRYFLHDSMGRLLRVRQPEQDVNPALDTTGNTDNNSWTAGFTYDNNGNALTATDAKNVTITNIYDNLNRVKTRSYSTPTPQVSYFYDGVYYDSNNVKQQATGGTKGALTQVKNAVSTSQTIAFDSIGKALTYQQVTEGQTYTSQYQYRLTGGLAQETYPSGRVMKYETDADGNLSRVSGQANANSQINTYANSFSYTASGATERLKLGNGRWETAQFNNRLQVTQLGLGNSATDASLWKVNYDYGEIDAGGNLIAANNNGNIAKQTISFAGLAQPFVQNYKYDAVNRLTEAKETSNGQRAWQQNWTYDRFGNRLSHVKFIGDTQIVLDNKTNPTIDSSTNRIATGQNYQYDSGGNVIQDADGRQFTFNGDNKQTQVKDAGNNVVGTYSYDGDGKRIKKVTNLETTIFVYSGGKLVAEYSTQISTTPKISYTTTDTLGSPRIITDQNGTVISRRDFMPFGEELSAGIGGRTGDGGQKYSSAQDTVRQKFTGYQKDDETQLDFAEARYYNNQHGRFTAVDPLLASGKSANPQTFNRYVYVMNNPLNSTDPSGMLPVYHRVHNGHDEYSTGDHSDGKGGWSVFEGEITVDATNGNRYTVDSNGITNLGNAATLDRIHNLFTSWLHDQVVGGAKGTYNFAAGIGNTPVDTPLVFPVGPSLHDLGVPQLFDRYTYNTTGERIFGYGAEIGLTILSVVIGGEASAAGEAGGVAEAASAVEGVFPAIKQGASGGPTAFQKFGSAVRNEALAENPTMTCVFCRQQGSQLDHAIPKSWGGNATIENAQWACSFCNASKGNRGLYPLNPAPGYEGPFPPTWWKK